ncbi:MAG TPA: SDR family NAD(P)-dependent oxidoreductase [Anaerovoracaceae bacterium]|nr:SDR family NAD(P)-dependent oxidoreductase [Anaerovoracaceae bacterium]
MKLSSNTVLITGGATGIGFALAEEFLAAGSKVLICGRREARLEEAQRKHPEILYKVCDVSDQNGREDLLQWARENEVNVLVNNAGIQRDIDFTKGMEDFASGESEIKINFETPVYLTALFTPYLMAQKEAAVLNVTSGLAYMTSPRPTVPIYVATKSAIHCFTAALRKQLTETPVKVFELIAPIMDTEINVEGRLKRGMVSHGIKPQVFAREVMRGLAADEYVIHSALEHYPQPLALLVKEND